MTKAVQTLVAFFDYSSCRRWIGQGRIRISAVNNVFVTYHCLNFTTMRITASLTSHETNSKEQCTSPSIPRPGFKVGLSPSWISPSCSQASFQKAERRAYQRPCSGTGRTGNDCWLTHVPRKRRAIYAAPQHVVVENSSRPRFAESIIARNGRAKFDCMQSAVTIP